MPKRDVVLNSLVNYPYYTGIVLALEDFPQVLEPVIKRFYSLGLVYSKKLSASAVEGWLLLSKNVLSEVGLVEVVASAETRPFHVEYLQYRLASSLFP